MEGVRKMQFESPRKNAASNLSSIIWLRFDSCVTLIVDKQVILDVFV